MSGARARRHRFGLAAVLRFWPGWCILSFLVSPPPDARGITLFGLIDTGELYASGNGGVTWSILSTLPVHDAAALAAGATSSQLFLASQSGGFFRSTDAGMTWSEISAVPAPDVVTMVSAHGRILLITRTGGVFASLDDGFTFNPVGNITAPDVVGATRQGGLHFALARTGAIYRSDDNGVDWNAVGSLTVSDAVGLLAFESKLYVLTGTGALARSDDLGATWSFISTLSQVGMTAFGSSGTEMLAGTAWGEVAGTTSGTGWTSRGMIGQLTLRALANDIPTTIGVESDPQTVLRFAPPWPNPARQSVTISLALPVSNRVSVVAYDVSGRSVAHPVANEWLPAGVWQREWRPGELPTGLYWLKASVGRDVVTRKLIWLKGNE